MKRYQDWANRELSTGKQVLTLALVGLLLVVLIPFLLIKYCPGIDQRWHLPDIYGGVINLIAGLGMIVAGLGFAWWSIYAQLTIGQGTPVPIAPTKKLVVHAPFTYCRNPMTLGTIIAYLGLCVWIGSISAMLFILILATVLLLYIKLLEEKELAARFGAEYLAYKRRTPFILPRKPRDL
jgi:protein-S-isoprenylcysteine O-methyltransferase Ste14